MGCYTWWVTIAICFTALTALQVNGSPEHPAEQFNGTTSTPEITVFNDDDMESDDEEDNKKHPEIEREEDTEDGKGLPDRDFMDTNPTVIGGQPVLEGDMALTESQWRKMRERKAFRNIYYRWRSGTDGYPNVPFRFGDNSVSRSAVLTGIRHWMQHTCIRFRLTTNTRQPHIIFIKSRGCWSYVGRLNQNGQAISIGNGCTRRGIVAHEIGHAMGFYHEQSRPDRDLYVRINTANIWPGMGNNFRKYSWGTINTYGVVYDYSSVMHYSSKAFSKNRKRTIIAKYPWAQNLIGQRYGLSHRDKLLANLMYGCIDKWLKKCKMTKDPCQRDGYLGANCRCVCRPGTYGSRCEL